MQIKSFRKLKFAYDHCEMSKDKEKLLRNLGVRLFPLGQQPKISIRLDLLPARLATRRTLEDTVEKVE